jgi:acyl carrier protein
MHDLQARLTQCFSATFGALPAAEIPQASTDTVGEWDSMTTITLLSVVEEEFGVRVPPEDILRFTSYDGVLEYLRERVGSRGAEAVQR